MTEMERILSAELNAERRRNESLQMEIFELLTSNRELKLEISRLKGRTDAGISNTGGNT
jgi:regulator of replication initiation timing